MILLDLYVAIYEIKYLKIKDLYRFKDFIDLKLF